MRRTAAALFLCAAFWTFPTAVPPAGAQAPSDQAGSAEEIRRRAEHALAAHERGEASTQEAIAHFEELVRLYQDDHDGWATLASLYRKANNFSAARRAAERATETAGQDRERAAALDALADVLIAQGDLAAARGRIEEALRITRRLATAAPLSASLPVDLSVLYERAGEAARGEGDLAAALDHFQNSLAIHRTLAETNPTGVEEDAALHLGNVAASLDQVGGALLVLGDIAGARSHFEESRAIRRRLGEDVSTSRDRIASVRIAERNLAVARRRNEQSLRSLRRLAAAAPDSQNHQRDIARTLDSVGGIFVAQRRLARARARFEESLAIRRRLAAADPSSPDLQRDVAASLGRVGDVSARAGDKQAVRRAGEEELAIAERMSRADPRDPGWVRLQALAHVRIARLNEADRSSRWTQARDLLESLDAQGRLAPPDRGLLYEARERAPRAADR